MSFDSKQMIPDYTPEEWRIFNEGKKHSTPAPETKIMFTHVQESLEDQKEFMKEEFKKITDRQDVANGRVKTNEIKIAYATGGLAVMGTIAVPILAWALFTLVNIEGEVRDVVSQELSDVQFELVQ